MLNVTFVSIVQDCICRRFREVQSPHQSDDFLNEFQKVIIDVGINIKTLLHCTLCTGSTDGLAVRRWTCDHLVHTFESHHGHLHNNLGQVVHTYVPLSPSSITWYRAKDGAVLRLGR